MTIKNLNPESAMLQQSEGQWQKYLALILHKYCPNGATITIEDIQKFSNDEKNYLLTHGHYDSIEFKLVTPQRAREIATWNSRQSGGKQ